MKCIECGGDAPTTNRIVLNPTVETRTVKRGGCSTPRTTTTETRVEGDVSVYFCDDHLHLAGKHLAVARDAQ